MSFASDRQVVAPAGENSRWLESGSHLKTTWIDLS